MGPKKGAEPEAVEPREGANVCYLTLNMGSEEAPAAPISITINSNTRVDILLDTAKTILLQSVTKLLATPQPLPLPAAPVVEPVEGEEPPAEDTDTAPPVDPVAEWQAMIDRLTAIQESLGPATIQELELQEVEQARVMEIQHHLAENGKAILPHSTKYLVGRMEGEEFKAF